MMSKKGESVHTFLKDEQKQFYLNYTYIITGVVRHQQACNNFLKIKQATWRKSLLELDPKGSKNLFKTKLHIFPLFF